MSKREELNAGLLTDFNTAGAQVHPSVLSGNGPNVAGWRASKDTQQYRIDLAELPHYRVKSHCNYDPAATGTTDFSVFQIEIMDEQLRQFYKGHFLLEVWSKQGGERIFQKVLQKEIRENQWELTNNTLVFKSDCDPSLIYVVFLNDRKMTSIKHPYADDAEVDIMYFDSWLIVAQENTIRFINISPADIQTTLAQYQNDPNGLGMPLAPAPLDRDYSGIFCNDRIVGMVNNYLRHELIFVCCNNDFHLSFHKLVFNKGQIVGEKRPFILEKYEAPNDPRGNAKAKALQRKAPANIVPSEVHQLYYIASEGLPFLLVLRKNQQLELIYNFNGEGPVFIENRMNVAHILGNFGDAITYKFHDGAIASAASFEKLNERNYLKDQEYYRDQILPPVGSTQHEIHRTLHFYQDAVLVNQTLFLVRDNAIFLVDTFTKKIISTHFGQSGFLGSRIVSLHKLRQQTEDDQGFKITTIKVVAVHQNGTLQVYTPEDLNLMTRWVRQEITTTAMSTNRDPVSFTFQNQNASNYIYIVTVNNQQNTQRVFQMMFNTQIIEFNNLKLAKGDIVLSVNSQSRQRELLGIIDQRYLAIYRNDKGNLIKLYQINHTRFEIREHLSQSSIFYFQRDYALIMSKQHVYRINVATNGIDQVKLASPVASQGGSAFIDASCFYFITAATQKQLAQNKISLSQVACVETSMIDATFTAALRGEEQSAIVDKNEKKGSKTELLHPSFTYGSSVIKRMDYDEFNSCINLLQKSGLEIVQVPLHHRNTLQFIGMAERSYYLCFKRHGDVLYALDKGNVVSKWSTVTGELLAKSEIKIDYSGYQMDRDLYDRDWFQFTLIYKPSVDGPQTNKLIKIDDKGQVVERLTFTHPVQPNQTQHLYFNSRVDKMIELLLSKSGSTVTATYNEYALDQLTKQWQFVGTLNNQPNLGGDQQFIEWHLRSLYPYSLNIHDFTQVNTARLRLNPTEDTFKFDKSGNKVKILNTLDGIEVVVDGRTGEVDSYMALQYSFPNTKASFYDKRCGQFFIQEVTSRLQNFYEYVRRQIFIEGKGNANEASVQLRLQTVDVSAKDYKSKYVIEQSYTQMDSMFFRQFINFSKDTTDKEQEKKVLRVFKKMSPDHIQRLVHNIFPRDDELFPASTGGNTLLHFLARYNLGFEVVDFIAKLAKKDGFVVPFLFNCERQTPLDLTVNRRDQKQTNSIIKLLQRAPMDHHSRFISHLIPQLIGEMNVPQLDKYFDRRRFQTGVCKTINLLKLKIDASHDMKSVATTLINDNKLAVESKLSHSKYAEQTVGLECFDMPLVEDAITSKKILEAQPRTTTNNYEIKLVKSFAAAESLDIFQQKTVRAYIDFMWPIAKSHIIKSVFLPYLAFIFYYLLYLVVLKRLSVVAESDPQFYEFTKGMFDVYDYAFKFVLFLGCFYFLFQDFQQINSLGSNSIVIWTYSNILPLAVMMFVVVWDSFFTNKEGNHHNDGLQKILYSTTAFLVWIRVVHLLKCFTHTSYLLRMATDILFRIRWLIAFIFISLLSFGFTFFFVEENSQFIGNDSNIQGPADGIKQMFYVLIGRYDVHSFSNTYQWILLVIVACFNAFFIFTLLVSISVVAFTKGGSDANGGVWSNEAYQDKASLIGLYSYLLEEKAVREPSKAYLLIATLTDSRKRMSKGDASNSQIGGGINSDPRIVQAKMMKSIDRRLNTLQSKVERALKEIQEKSGAAGAAGGSGQGAH